MSLAPQSAQVSKAEQQALERHLSERTALIVDTDEYSAESIQKMFVSLGSKIENIFIARDFGAAMAAISEKGPRIVVACLDLGAKSGLDLLTPFREKLGRKRDAVFFLVSETGTQTSVARAVEEELDGYLLKPFMREILRSNLIAALSKKFNPSEYLTMIEAARQQIDAGQLDEAAKTLQDSKQHHATPALACYWLGEISRRKKDLPAARAYFEEGLKFNKIHFRCLKGLLDVLTELKAWTEAYAVVRKICGYFPSNPEYLAQALRLAIQTQSVDDVEKYYADFVATGSKDRESMRYIRAALLVCAKYYLSKKVRSRAMQLYEKVLAQVKAPEHAELRARMVKEISNSFIEYGLLPDAEELVKSQRNELKTYPDFQAAAALVQEAQKKNRESPAG